MSTLISIATHIAGADRHMLAIVPDSNGHGEQPALPDEWAGGNEYEIYIRVAQELAEQRLRFELWDSAPPPPGDPPEVEGTFLMDIPEGTMSISQIAMGGIPDVFDVPPGRYHLRLSGYGRAATAERTAELWRMFSDGRLAEADFTAACQELEGQEHYLAQFWPAT